MSKLNDLINKLCPDGVEFVKLGETCEVLRGKRLTKKQLSETEKYPVFHGGIQPIGFYSKKNRNANTVMIINVGASAGTIGYKGSKKKTPFAAGMSAEAAAKAAIDNGVKKVEVFVKGLGAGRENAIRSLQTAGLEITSINDVTPVPHNGCRPRKTRRM